MLAQFLQPRCVASLFLFLLSLMVIIPATHIFLWYAVLLATEYGHWFFLLVLALFAWEMAQHVAHLNPWTIGFLIASGILFLLPLFEAELIAARLPAQLTAAFNDESTDDRLPSRLSFIQLWQRHGSSAVDEIPRQYTSSDGAVLNLRIYRQGKEVLPCVLVVHGGGWNSGNELQLPEISRQLARAGYCVASATYRLAPKFHWPVPKTDITDALAYLKANATELSIDPTRFVLLGRSAGGQVSLATAYALHDPAIKGCIAAYAPTDMFFAYATGKEDDILKSRPLVRAFMGAKPEEAQALYHDASPLDFVDAGTPPTLLIHGGRDEIVWVRHSERLRDRLVASRRPVLCLEFPWATHGFDVNAYGPGGQLEYYATCWFLDSVFRH